MAGLRNSTPGIWLNMSTFAGVRADRVTAEQNVHHLLLCRFEVFG